MLATTATHRPAMAAEPLQCVPYARALSGVEIFGDAWTWWDQAKGHYRRGHEPRAGAVIALANTEVMPLGHVAVVSRVIDDRRILLRHANWSGPGVIEEDVLAVDTSEDNDWSQVRIWWGQTQEMGARDNPVNGFIYPGRVSPQAVLTDSDASTEERRLLIDLADDAKPRKAALATPRLALDIAPLRHHSDATVSGGHDRTLADIIAEVKTQAHLR
jgi:hypothetical protein